MKQDEKQMILKTIKVNLIRKAKKNPFVSTQIGLS